MKINKYATLQIDKQSYPKIGSSQTIMMRNVLKREKAFQESKK